MKRLVLCVAGLLLTAVAFLAPAQQIVEVIELRYSNADDVIPILKPLMPPDATISGMKNKLVVRTTRANLEELRKVLDVVDSAPKRLMISVRQGESAAGKGTDIEVEGRVGTGPDTVKGQAREMMSGRSTAAAQSVQVLEGNAALIRTGVSVPILNREITSAAGGVVQQRDTVEYRDVVTGFYAQPRVNGDQVTVQLATRRDSVIDNRRGSVQIQHVESVVSGRLGEWLEVGGILQDEVRDEAGIVYYRSGDTSDRRRIFLKVDELR
jgi:type II secretory pathway component GspD/PulD (secretin)